MSRVPKIKLPAADGVAPAPETIRSGANPDFVKFFAVRADRVTSPDVLALMDWLLGPEEQKLAKRAGYVKLPKPFNANPSNTRLYK